MVVIHPAPLTGPATRVARYRAATYCESARCVLYTGAISSRSIPRDGTSDYLERASIVDAITTPSRPGKSAVASPASLLFWRVRLPLLATASIRNRGAAGWRPITLLLPLMADGAADDW